MDIFCSDLETLLKVTSVNPEKEKYAPELNFKLNFFFIKMI